MTQTTSQTGLRVIRAMLVVVVFGLFTKLGGFLVTGVLIGRMYGSGDVTDAFFAAYQSVIFLLFSIAVKGIMPALMPLFIEEMEQRGEASAWRFASGVINLVIVVALLTVGACIVFAPQIMRLLVPGFFTREAGPLSVTMVRIMAPGLIALCLSVVTYALLNSYKIFSIPSAAEAVQKLIWATALFCFIIFVSRGVLAIALGFLLGVLAQIAVNLFGLRDKLSFYRFTLGGIGPRRLLIEIVILLGFILGIGAAWWVLSTLNWSQGWQLGAGMGAGVLYLLLLWWRAKGSKSLMGRFVALMVPLLLGIIIAKYRDLATNYFTSFTQSGIFSDKQFAERVGNLPTVVWAYALAIAMFPYLCEMAARKDLSSFGSLITRALRMIALFFVPFSLMMVILAQPIVQLVYDNGSWPAEHVRWCGLALAVYSAAMFFYAIENVLMQSFFSIQRMWVPTVIGMLASIAQIAFLYLGIVALGYHRPEEIFWFVIVAFPVSRTMKNLVLIFILRWYVPILPARETVQYILRLTVVSAVVMGVTLFSYIPISNILNVSALKVEDVVVDTFNPGEHNAIGECQEAGAPPRGWLQSRPSNILIENIAGTDETAEYALRVGGAATVERDLARFDLSKPTILSFKVMSNYDTVLRVTLSGEKGQRDIEFKVKRSTRREKYEWRFGNAVAEIGPLKSLVFTTSPTSASEREALWLDTIVFRADFPMSQRLKFEAYKLIQTAFPMGLGFFALVFVAVLLRVEEMGIIWTWLKQEGLARIKDKFKGVKHDKGPGGPTVAPTPEVET